MKYKKIQIIFRIEIQFINNVKWEEVWSFVYDINDSLCTLVKVAPTRTDLLLLTTETFRF